MSGRGKDWVWLRGTSRGRSRGRGGRSYKSGDGDKAVSVGRTKGSASYTMTEKGAMSMSEISSLTDISTADLTCLDVGLQSSLLKRLFREYVEVRKYKLPNVSVEPLMHNFTEWHGNIKGPADTPYEGGIFHFVIEFTNEYPRSPPKIVMQTRIEHPCVNSSGYITLDVLNVLQIKKKNFRPPSNSLSKYQYWFPGYTTLSILILLEALLYEGTAEIAFKNLSDLREYETKKARWESGIKFSVEQSLHASCNACKHRPRKPWPPFESVYTPVTRENTDFLYLEKAICFFSLKNYEEAALGIGINYTKDARTGAVQTVRCVPEVISLSAFKGSKVTEVWGRTFTHWMPIYLSHYSPDRSMYLAERSLSSIYTGGPTDFKPSMALDFFPRLLSISLVNFFNAEDGAEALQQLRCYCYMHRLLLQFLKTYPTLIDNARDSVIEFIEKPNSRQNYPVTGLLLIYITFTGQKWTDLMESFMMENFDRNVKHIIKQFPDLNTTQPNPIIDETRVSKSYSAYNVTGLRFIMFQLMFNRIFLIPDGCTVDSVIQQYDECHSLLSRSVEDKLLEQIEPILAINNFSDVYKQVGWHDPSDSEMVSLLRTAVGNSLSKHYHGGKGIDVLSPEEFEKQRLGSIRPLNELLAEEGTTEDEWKEFCETRFGLTDLPETYTSISLPWKHLYLQHNLQELVGKLNDNPDFKLLYDTLKQSQDLLTHFDLVTFNPDNIKSQYFFLSRIIEMLSHLTHLTISKGEKSLGEKGFKELVKGMAKSSGSLQVLDMRYLGIQEAHVSKLAESHLTSEGLTTIILEGNHLGTEGTIKLSQLLLKHLSLPNLSELNLRSCHITDSGMEALAEALLVKRNIRKLNLSKNIATANGVAKVITNLSYNPCIEEINLSDMSKVGGRNDSLANALTKLFQLTVSLKELILWKTDISQSITDANMKKLSENQTLVVLDTGSSGIAKEPFGLVLGSKRSVLAELDLGNNSLDVSKCRRIVIKSKEQSSQVVKLNLQSNHALFNVKQTETKDVEIMRKFLSVTFVNVTHLNISRCGLNSNAAAIIGNVLALNTALINLDMGMNNIGKHGARFIATGLTKNTNLRVLRLDKNELRTSGAHFLAPVLERPGCLLEELHLFCNYIDVPGAKAICKALKTNQHLRFIDLGLNKVRKRGAAYVLEMLAVNKTLETLALKFNYIPDAWAIKIIKQVVDSSQSRVSDIRLAGNSLQYETLVSVASLLQESRCSIKFDLSSRAQYLDPERMERTVYVSPLAANITPDMVKKMFYTKKCGAITAVTTEKHIKKKAAFAKAKYALVEFAHKDSVELAVDLMKQQDADIGGFRPRITRAGLGTSSNRKTN